MAGDDLPIWKMSAEDEDITAAEKKHAREFCEALGAALLAWQYVEKELFLVFSNLIRGRDFDVVSAAYHAVPGFRSRLGMIDAAAQIAVVATPLEAEWKKLCKRVVAASKNRNVLAHFGSLGRLPREGPVTLTLARSIFDARLKGDKREFGLNDIRRFEKSFDEVEQSIGEFCDRLTTFLERQGVVTVGHKPPSVVGEQTSSS